MLRICLTIGSALAAGFSVFPVQAQQVANYKFGMSAGNQREERPQIPQDLTRLGAGDWRLADQPNRWIKVGRCVAQRAPETSLALVVTDPHSMSFKAAYKQLNPVFDNCFPGFGTVSRGVASYRRAALADALKRPITP